MDIDVLNSQLYDKMVASQEKMKDWLQSQSFDDMMRNAREYLVREDIVLAFEFHDLSDEQVFALWEREDPLAELYAAFEKVEDRHMEIVKDTLENHADFLIAEKQRRIREMPVYVQTAAYAKEHGEADLHSESHKANVMCANAIEDSIALHYDFEKKRLDPAGAAEILDCSDRNEQLSFLPPTSKTKVGTGALPTVTRSGPNSLLCRRMTLHGERNDTVSISLLPTPGCWTCLPNRCRSNWNSHRRKANPFSLPSEKHPLTIKQSSLRRRRLSADGNEATTH